MQPGAIPEALRQPAIAEDDLDSARQLLQGTTLHTRNAAYLCQQAAEKALKALLGAYGEPLVRTHELELLLKRCERLDPTISTLRPAVSVLDPYGVTLRYVPPGMPLQLPESEARDAIQHAGTIVAYVRASILRSTI